MGARSIKVAPMGRSYARLLRIATHAAKSPSETIRISSEASALMSGVTPSFTFEKMYIGSVLAPGPDTKLAMTRSSSDSVNASSQPASMAGFAFRDTSEFGLQRSGFGFAATGEDHLNLRIAEIGERHRLGRVFALKRNGDVG